MRSAADPFFIGWTNRLPRGMRGVVLGVAAGLLLVLPLLALMLARAADDPGPGNWAGDVTLRGTLAALPYPLLYAAPDAAHPKGHTVLLSAAGKAQIDPAAVAGHRVQAFGALVRRGDLDMLVINDPTQLRVQDAATVAAPAPVPLGRWRIAGEICDGKCAAGAMRPGAGIAHRACASLCLLGDIPPVLVSAQPAAGSSFFLLAGPDGGPMPRDLLKLIGLRLQLDGTLERRGDLPVFRVDPASARVL